MANETEPVSRPLQARCESGEKSATEPLTKRNRILTSLPSEHEARPSPATVADAAHELAKMWAIFPIGQTNPISLRVISPKGAPTRLRPMNLTFNAAEYPDLEDRKRAFADAALELNSIGYNSYIVFNQIKADFEGNQHNRLAVSDANIASRQLLLIDLDRTGTLDAPATDTEIEKAFAISEKISAHLDDQCGLNPFRVMSGNGIHLYLSLDDIPNDTESKTCCQELLKALAFRFNSAEIKVDQSVYNASRITKVPGTIARKGCETAERPFRMARVL